MYNAFFGFSESPFSLSPDPAFFYRSEQHEEALANLVYGVQARKGFIVLSGEVGTGKTTMLECLRDYLEAQYIEFAFLFNSRINTEQFFEMIAYDLDLPCTPHVENRGPVRAQSTAGGAGAGRPDGGADRG